MDVERTFRPSVDLGRASDCLNPFPASFLRYTLILSEIVSNQKEVQRARNVYLKTLAQHENAQNVENSSRLSCDIK